MMVDLCVCYIAWESNVVMVDMVYVMHCMGKVLL